MGAGGEGEDDTTTPQLTEAYTTVLLSRPSYSPVLACSRVSGVPELHVTQCAFVRCVNFASSNKFVYTVTAKAENLSTQVVAWSFPRIRLWKRNKGLTLR